LSRSRERAQAQERKRGRRLAARAALATGGAAGASVLFAPGAQAATFEVNSTADPGDGTCDATECTLREAIGAANGAAGADTVTFAATVTGSIDLNAGDLEITDELIVQGPGAEVLAVDGYNNDRVFYIGTADTQPVTISGLTIRNGQAPGLYSVGGGIYASPGSGTLRVANSVVAYNQAFEVTGKYDAEGVGGGIAAVETAGLTIVDSQVRQNNAAEAGGGIFAYDTETTITGSTIRNNSLAKYLGGGGGVFSDEATLTITGSRVVSNNASEGAGVLVEDTASGETAGVSITGSDLSGNIAKYQGGGIFLDEPDSPVTIQGTTIDQNTALFRGGGLASDVNDAAITITDSEINDNLVSERGAGVYLDTASAPVTVERSSVLGNQAGGTGGGVLVADSDADGTLTFDATTVANNKANDAAGLYLDPDSPATIQNTTISGNAAERRGGGLLVPQLDYYGPGDGGSLAIRNTTISGNAAEGPASPEASGPAGGVYIGDTEGDVEISSSILADSTGGDLATNNVGSNTGALDVGFSVIEDPAGSSFNEAPAGSNQLGVDPVLGPLADNGGPTETHLPGGASPALDAGIANSLATDQRGEPRTVDLPEIANRAGSDGTDVGAVEPSSVVAPGVCDGDPAAKQVGTDASERIIGTDGADELSGAGGDDTVDGVGGPDCVQGDAGNDRARGGGGSDEASGGAGNDKVVGAGGQDELKGGAGRDRVRGGEAADRLKGGGGDDRLKGAGGDDRVSGGAGADRINCGAGDDVAIAGGNDTVAPNCETVK
jgi:CSLREA domain-containing protein